MKFLAEYKKTDYFKMMFDAVVYSDGGNVALVRNYKDCENFCVRDEVGHVVMDFFIYNNAQYFIFTDGKCFKRYGNNIHQLQYALSKSTHFKNHVIVYEYDFDIMHSMYNVIDLDTNELCLDNWIEGRIFISNDCFLIVDGQNLIFKTKEIEWRVSVDSFVSYKDTSNNICKVDVKQFIGVYDNSLWIQLGGERLIALDIQSGEFKHYFEGIPKSQYGDNYLDKRRGVIRILDYHRYLEFNLTTLQLEEKYRNDNLFFRSCNHYDGDDCLYFCGTSDWANSVLPDAFGVFDTITCCVTWMETQQEGWGKFYNPPQANEKLMAVLDDKGNLLVFEK